MIPARIASAVVAAAVHVVSSTCYDQGTVTASGKPPRLGFVAQNTLPFGAHIRLTRPVFGRRDFTVEDRIGAYSELDFFNSSSTACLQYGRRTVRYVVVAKKRQPPIRRLTETPPNWRDKAGIRQTGGYLKAE